MTRRPICLVCLSLMLFLCLADRLGIPLIRGNPLPESQQKWLEKHPQTVLYGEVERCTQSEFSQSIYLKNSYFIYQSKKIPIKNIRVFLKEKEDTIPAGTWLKLSGRLERVQEMRNPGEFDSRQYYACDHIYYFLRKAKILKRIESEISYRQILMNAKEHFRKVLEACAGDEAAVFSAVVLGDRTGLETEIKLRYQMAGIVHMLAVSGLHISVLGLGLYGLLVRTGMGLIPAGILSGIVMLQYGIFTGGSVSAMRAVCMFLILIGAKMAGRIYDMSTALSVSAMLLLLESPAYLYNSGFLLSYGAVIGIEAVLPALDRIVKIPGKTGKAFMGSLSVQMVTLPLMLYFFGEISVAGIFLNLLVLPTVGMVLISGMMTAIAGSLWLAIGVGAAVPGRFLLFLYEKLCELAGRLPVCTWVGGRPELWKVAAYYGILMAVCILAEKERGLWLKCFMVGVLALSVAGLQRQPEPYLKITCLDIGQGDGIVMETPDGSCYLIDGGSSDKSDIAQYQLLPYLKSRGISRIDGIFISHTDMDHISGIQELLTYTIQNINSVKINALFLPDWKQPPKAWKELEHMAKCAGLKVYSVGCGKTLQKGNLTIEILAPEQNASGGDVNEDAMVVMVKYHSFSGLFTGDIGMDTEKKLLQEKLLEDVDFLKVGHHGSRYSTSEAFLKNIKPEYAVISCSSTNTYGHPAEETIERLKAAGTDVRYTMKGGAVSIYTDGKRIAVEEYSNRKD